MARYTLVYEDGVEQSVTIRRRFEVNDVLVRWGELAFRAHPHRMPRTRPWRGPNDAGQWGADQLGAEQPNYISPAREGSRLPVVGNLWLFGLPSARPTTDVRELRIEALDHGRVSIAGMTATRRVGSPLRHGPLATLRLFGPPGERIDPEAVSVDLGVIARRYTLTPSDIDDFLSAADAGLGRSREFDGRGASTYVDLTCSESATLMVQGRPVPLADVLRSRAGTDSNGQVRVELVPRRESRVQMTILDANGAPVPARVHVRTADGRYLPPHGH